MPLRTRPEPVQSPRAVHALLAVVLTRCRVRDACGFRRPAPPAPRCPLSGTGHRSTTPATGPSRTGCSAKLDPLWDEQKGIYVPRAAASTRS